MGWAMKCIKCGEEKEHTLQNFSSKRGSDGILKPRTVCKDCYNDLRRIRELSVCIEQQLEITCCECGLVKPIGDYYNNKYGPNGKTRACKSCEKKRMFKYTCSCGVGTNSKSGKCSDCRSLEITTRKNNKLAIKEEKALKRAEKHANILFNKEHRTCKYCKETKTNSEFTHRRFKCDSCYSSTFKPINGINRDLKLEVSRYRAKGKKRNLVNTLSDDKIVELLNTQHCHYCGIDHNLYSNFVKNSKDINHPYHNSFASVKYSEYFTIDRKDNSIGYTDDNAVSCCWLCNSVKGDILTYDEMLALGPTIKNKYTPGLTSGLPLKEKT